MLLRIILLTAFVLSLMLNIVHWRSYLGEHFFCFPKPGPLRAIMLFWGILVLVTACAALFGLCRDLYFQVVIAGWLISAQLVSIWSRKKHAIQSI